MDTFDLFGDELDLSPEERRRLDIEWTALNALREVIGIALKASVSPTYRQILALAQRLAPDLFHPDRSIIARGQESSGAREYRQRADALSKLEDRQVTPLEAINRDIERDESLVKTGGDRDLVRRRLDRLYQIRQEFQLLPYEESQLILNDVFNVDRELPTSGRGKDYSEFQLPNSRVLRIRMLHPGRAEHLTGADVLYEHYWEKKRVVRLAAVQYKIWEGRVLYKSVELERQLARLHQVFCDNDLCKEHAASKRKDAYRLPYCAAFLRPTDKLQCPDSRLISSGYHIPICVVNRLWQDTRRGGKRLSSRAFRSEAVTHRVFEELFNTNMLGSRWLTYEELERLYHEHGLLYVDEHIVVHAQDFGI
jgi:hypothetical protein